MLDEGRKDHKYAVVDEVLLFIPHQNRFLKAKFTSFYDGPFQIISQRGPNSFVFDLYYNGKPYLANVALLKPYINRALQLQEINSAESDPELDEEAVNSAAHAD